MSRVHALAVRLLLVFLGSGLLLADNGPNHKVKQSFPIQLGTSGGNVNNRSSAFCCSGTLGSLVSKVVGGTTVQYILSNNHVLADTDTGNFGQNISQPGLIDVGCNVSKTNTVAHLSQWITLGTQNVDAAIAEVVAGAVNSTGAILDVGVPASTTLGPAVGIGVAKSGRTTGLTCSSIGSINTNVNVQYQKGCGSGKKFVISYTGQVVINSTSFSAGGDSGSLIVSSAGAEPVALLFAGSSSTTIGNPIGQVTSALGVSFVGGGTHAVTCPPSGAAAQGGKSPSPQSVERATAAKERHADRLMAAEAAIQGVGVGAADDNPEEAVVVLYVETGRAHGPLPDELDGVRTKIIQTDRFVAYGWNEPESPGVCTPK